jgi:catechol 2,3-dioxygenase-like lactoylglutathione lyase family enzyme
LTHVAFQVTDIQRTIDFYASYTRMRVVHERPDPQRGSRVVWLREQEALGSMTIVLFQKDDPAAGDPHSSHPPLNHLGFAVESRAAVDAIARRAAEERILVLPPSDYGGVVGYICEISDPDGTLIEFSHGQRL